MQRVLIVLAAVIATCTAVFAVRPVEPRTDAPQRNTRSSSGMDGLVESPALRFVALAQVATRERLLTARVVDQWNKDHPPKPQAARSTSHATGGGFPGDCIAAHESDSAGGYSAYNSTPADNGHASGKYQVTSGTWNGYGGYSEARAAPPDVQEAQARDLWSRNPGAWNGTGCPGTG